MLAVFNTNAKVLIRIQLSNNQTENVQSGVSC